MDSEDKTLNELEFETEEEWFDAPEEDDQTETSTQPQSYVTVLKEEEIWRRLEIEIQIASEFFSISKSKATLLLSHFHWDINKLREEWFDDAEDVRKSVGILKRPLDPISDDKIFVCGGCVKSYPLEKFASVSCGHLLCSCCWTSHINNIINESPAADWYWKLKCPYDSCPAFVGRGMIKRFASEEEKSSYDQYLLRSYVDDKKTMKWCPAPECSCAIDLSLDSGNFDVTCSCLLRFCWNCNKDVHSPVDCETAAKWLAMINISDNQKNPNWLLENTVLCPKCNRRFGHNQDGSLKMTCLPPCNYDFCWLCSGDWTEHGEETCNIDDVWYEDIEETDQLREMAESDSDRYKDCYENWQSNDTLMQKAKANLQKLRTDVIPELSNIQLPTKQQLEFILEAGFQVMESRRILKWTYAYEFYLPEDTETLLKIRQDNVKLLLKELDHCIETVLPRFLNPEGHSENFNSFRNKLTGLTSATRNHNESLVRGLEEGLGNVAPAPNRPQREYITGEGSGSGSNHDD